MGDTMPLPDIKAQTWLDDREHLEAFAKSFDPAARLAVKKSCLWVGALKDNATTLGRTVYIPEHWSIGQVARVIPHEVRGHVKQFRYCGLGIHPNLGFFPGMFLLYVWGSSSRCFWRGGGTVSSFMPNPRAGATTWLRGLSAHRRCGTGPRRSRRSWRAGPT